MYILGTRIESGVSIIQMSMKSCTEKLKMTLPSKIIYILVFLLLGGCSPLFGVGSFMHSLVTGNTAGMVSGGAGIVVKENTGKSIFEHFVNPDKKSKNARHIEWIYEVDKFSN